MMVKMQMWTLSVGLSSNKTTAEALGRVTDDLTKFAVKLQGQDLLIALSSLAQRLQDYKIANQTNQ